MIDYDTPEIAVPLMIVLLIVVVASLYSAAVSGEVGNDRAEVKRIKPDNSTGE